MTTSWSRGMSTLRFLRLCSRAPLMRIDFAGVVAISFFARPSPVETNPTRVGARSSNRALYGECKAEGRESGESCSQPRNLRQVVEVRVARVERQAVLHDQGGDPQVVLGDRCALATELLVQRGVAVCRLIIGEQRLHVRTGEKLAQPRFVLTEPSPA